MSDGYSDFSNPKRQKELLERALEIKKKHYGPYHFQFAYTQGCLGYAYGALDDPHKAKKLLEGALHIFEKHYKP
jgi:hypothetical protein